MKKIYNIIFSLIILSITIGCDKKTTNATTSNSDIVNKNNELSVVKSQPHLENSNGINLIQIFTLMENLPTLPEGYTSLSSVPKTRDYESILKKYHELEDEISQFKSITNFECGVVDYNDRVSGDKELNFLYCSVVNEGVTITLQYTGPKLKQNIYVNDVLRNVNAVIKEPAFINSKELILLSDKVISFEVSKQ